jgi:pimeloyl-ACP methyl ester carboxylesterase
VPTGARGYAEIVAPLFEQLAAEAGPPVIVGHSFGGRVAACLAASRPELVGSLVLTGVPLVRSALPAGTPSRRYQLVRAAARWHLVSEARLEASRRRYGSADYRAATGVMRDSLVVMINESYESELAALRCPVSLVWGALDATTPVAVAERARELCDQATLTVLQGVGHLVPTEAPGALVTAALDLLGARG